MKIRKPEQGFITMIVALLFIIVAVVLFAYLRVKGAQAD